MTNGVSKMSEVGTLMGLGLNDGDIVELVSEGRNVKGFIYPLVPWTAYGGCVCGIPFGVCDATWRIVSRKAGDPKTWSDMTASEKGEILLAWHDGKDVEISRNNGEDWVRVVNDGSKAFMFDSLCYRIADQKQVVTTEALYATEKLKGFGRHKGVNSKYKLTFTATNGIPDCDTVKMEVVE